MGTRSTTKFYEKFPNGEKFFIGGFYRQYDGYISGNGKELKDCLKNKKIINGISGETTEEAFNGIDCLGAYVISEFKDGIGGIYLTYEDDTQEYNYIIWNEGDAIFIEIEKYGEIVYSGDINEMPEED